MELRFDFAVDDSLTGFRLDNFEFYNWGTYNNSIVSLNLEKQNALLTGDIGSGKSTVVDAITTLLVPHQKIIYNKAAGAGSKERSIYSYIVGEYKSEKDDNYTNSKAIALRDERSFTTLLATFKNDGYDETITLAQFFYILNNKEHKFFVVSQKSLSIKEDFFIFKDIKDLKKRLRNTKHTRVYDSFKDYSIDFRRLMGIKNEQALNLFYQTVSLKEIGNLTSFIRLHMLEKSDIDAKIDELCKNFADLNHAHSLVLRAKKQIELLLPIDKEGKKYEKYIALKIENELMKDALGAYFASIQESLLKLKIDELDIELTKANSMKESVDNESYKLSIGDRDLRVELERNGGNRLNMISSEIESLSLILHQLRVKNSEYNNLAKELNLQTVSNEHRFLNNMKELEQRLDSIGRDTDSIQNDKISLGVIKTREQKIQSELKEEIFYLENNRSNIPQRVSKIRDAMADKLGLDSNELPFVGELIEVKDAKWEGAIQRVLNSFALSLIVENRYYDEVSAYVESSNLKGRLVYLKVDKNRDQSSFVEITSASLLNKIEIKADSPLFVPVQIMLHERFNIPCVESIEDFRRFKKALTIHGQFKTNLSRHEKDDRFDINDKSRWVLGWNNLQKLQQLQDEYILVIEKLELLDIKILTLQDKSKSLQKQRDNLRDILKFKHFNEIDWYSYSKKIDALNSERDELSESSNIIKVLQKQIEAIAIKIIDIKKKSDDISKKVGKLEVTLENRKEELGDAQNIIENSVVIQSSVESLDRLFEELVDDTTNLNNYKIQNRTLNEHLNNKLRSLNDTALKSANKIITYMNNFSNQFQTVSKDFDPSIESLSEYREKLSELKKDDLPKWEKKFKELFKEKTIQNIVMIQATLEQQSSEIKDKIFKINESLGDIEYNEGTFIELIAETTMDVEIREFKQSIKSAISGSISSDYIYDENKFLQIKEIIDRFNGREGYVDIDKKWRKNVTDVRNWFNFSAMERYLSDNSEKEYYAHSGGKSGGQKEKLAYTVLASSLAFQFGIEYNKVQSRSFRFVMIDEAFGRGSDESTKYALRLFEKLKLQLLVITPKQKINIIEPFVKSVHFVHNQDGMSSSLLSMKIEEYIQKKS